MKFQPDDPKLTAYALGELDPGETAAVAAAVENSADCRQAVEETRETAGMLKGALQTETCPALSPTQRAAIETTLADETVAAVSDRRIPSPNQQPAVRDRRYSSAPVQPSFLAAVLAWRPQVSTVVTWATACLITVVGWATWLEVFCKTDRDKNQQATAYAIKLNPKPATSQPPSLAETNQLAMQTAASPLFSTPAGSNGVLVATYGICAGYGYTNIAAAFGTPVTTINGSFSGTAAPTTAPKNGLVNSFMGAGGGTWTYSGTLSPWMGARNGTWEFSTYDSGPGATVIAQASPSPANANTMAKADSYRFYASSLEAARPDDNPPAGFSGGIYKVGPNTLTLNGNNTFAGGTIVNGGRMTSTFTAPESKPVASPPPPPPSVINSVVAQNLAAKAMAPRPSMQATQVRITQSRSGSIQRYGSSSVTAVSPASRVRELPTGNYYSSPFNTETYARIRDNPFLAVAEQPLSTFSIDVDTASYANVRRFLMQGSLPPRDAVRIEEMINYFTYDYAKPKGGEPFSVNIEAAGCPWNAGHRLVRIGLKGREVSAAKRPPCNLVFLIDVSGSMGDANKLSLIKPALRMLVEQLTENERVGIVVYNQSARVLLHSISGDRKQEIIDAIESLHADGSTNGADGIRLAYDMASRHFVERGVNRVILCTDGDFNVGTTELAELTRLIEQKRQSGVFLSVLGFGAGNLKDATLERLADKGNGHYAYIDSFFEARKVLVEQVNGTLVTIAKDVKIQVEFNPAKVAGYRLIGYEDRLLRKEDFNNDRKDAGEIGAGHTVTALYEIVPAGQPLPTPAVDPLKYQPVPKPVAPASDSNEWLTVKLRYKQPDGDKSALIEQPLTDGGKGYGAASRDFKFAASVAAFGMVLRDSPHKGNATLAGVLELAEESRGPDASGYRTEFLSLVKKAQALGKR